MPRYARCAAPDVIYHIIHRGNNKQAIFYSPNDYSYFLKLIKEAKKKYMVSIYSYALMINHIHFLLKSCVAEHLAKFMKFIAQRHAQYINHVYKRTGTLWEGRFKSSPVSADSYLIACSRYIEMNPVRAGLVSSPEDYKYTSYAAKIGLREDKILDFDPWYLSLGADNTERQRQYQKFFKESIPEDEWKIIRECINKNGVFGNDEFKKQIEEVLGRKIELRGKGRPRKDKK